MRHDIWPAIKSALSGTFSFGGRTGRDEFWLWIGTLFATSVLVGPLQTVVWGSVTASWPSLQSLIEGSSVAQYTLGRLRMAWPETLALTPFPLGYVGMTSARVFPLMPLYLVINLLAIAPVVRRSRDAGYSPFWTVTLLYWSVIGTGVIIAVSQALAVGLGWSALYILMATSGYLFYASQAVSTLAALAPIYRLSAPSKPGPNPIEAPK